MSQCENWRRRLMRPTDARVRECPCRVLAGLRLSVATVHAAKGIQADHVVVLDLADRQLGFPGQIEDDPLLELVMPHQGAGYPHAEERRLLYVAMTRARLGLWLVADRSRPSVFVRGADGAPRRAASPRVVRGGAGPAVPPVPRRAPGRGDGRRDALLEPPAVPLRGAALPAVPPGVRGRTGRAPRVLERELRRGAGRLPRLRRRACWFRAGRAGGSFRSCTEYGSDQPCTDTAGPVRTGRQTPRRRA